MGIGLIHLKSFVAICVQNCFIHFALEKWNYNSFSYERKIKVPQIIML